MFIRLRQPIVIFGNSPCERGQIVSVKSALAKRLIQHRRADPTNIAVSSDGAEFEERKERARRLGQNVDWDKDPKYWPKAVAIASASSKSGSEFGRAISAACERVSFATVKQHAERVRKEASRYRPMQRRQRTASD